MSRSRRARIDTLKNRAQHLRERIERGELSSNSLSYDRAEIMAITWAIPILEGHVEANRVLHEQLGQEKRDDRG